MRTFIRWLAVGGFGTLAVACGASSGGFTGTGGDNSGDDGGGGGGSSGSSSGGTSGGGTSSGGFVNTQNNNMGTGTCQTGLYNGMFSCTFYLGSDAGLGAMPDSGALPSPITGMMSFMLTQNIATTGETDTTDTASGKFAAATGGFIAADADLNGTLDCGQGKFTGQLLNGFYGLSFNISMPPVADPNNKFQGPLISDYDGKTSSFVNGEWSMAIAGEGACIGSWTATYAGPGDGGAPVDAGGQ